MKNINVTNHLYILTTIDSVNAVNETLNNDVQTLKKEILEYNGIDIVGNNLTILQYTNKNSFTSFIIQDENEDYFHFEKSDMSCTKISINLYYFICDNHNYIKKVKDIDGIQYEELYNCF